MCLPAAPRRQGRGADELPPLRPGRGSDLAGAVLPAPSRRGSEEPACATPAGGSRLRHEFATHTESGRANASGPYPGTISQPTYRIMPRASSAGGNLGRSGAVAELGHIGTPGVCLHPVLQLAEDLGEVEGTAPGAGEDGHLAEYEPGETPPEAQGASADLVGGAAVLADQPRVPGSAPRGWVTPPRNAPSNRSQSSAPWHDSYAA